MLTGNLTIATIVTKTVPFLAERGLTNPRLEADLMLAAVLDLPRVKLYADWDRPLQPDEVQRYREMIVRRVQGWPLAYLTGKKTFLSWDFNVTPQVLIPRPETEELVEAVAAAWKGRDTFRGVDIGTGSGVIGIALAKLFPNSTWYGIDLSAAALEVARSNATRLGVDERIQFIEGDLLAPLMQNSLKFDLLVSNPPYIPGPEIKGLQPEVQKEPGLALDGGNDGLAVYRRMIPQMVTLLADDGLIALEHGYNQRQPLTELLTASGCDCQSVQDLSGWDRILLGRKQRG